MSRLFQQSGREWEQGNDQLDKCYEEIEMLKQQLSTLGMQHLLKVKDLQFQLESSKNELGMIGELRSTMEAQMDELAQELSRQLLRNKQLKNQLSEFNCALQSRQKEFLDLRSQLQSSNSIPEDTPQLGMENLDITQEELTYVNEKVQLLQLKNQALSQELKEVKLELQSMSGRQAPQIEKYQQRLLEMGRSIGQLGPNSQYFDRIKSQNEVLHKQLQIKILEVQDLRRELNQQEANRPESVPEYNNLEQYLQEAIEQINQLRRDNELLKAQQPPDKNTKMLKAELIAVKTEYSNSLKENNFLIQENARVQKQKNQLFLELERQRKGEHLNKEKAYMTVCEQKNHMEVELMNTYDQIEKLNYLLLNKEQELQQAMQGRNCPTLGQSNVVKLATKAAQKLNHNHWDSIQSKIDHLRNQNQSLKRGEFNQTGSYQQMYR